MMFLPIDDGAAMVSSCVALVTAPLSRFARSTSEACVCVGGGLPGFARAGQGEGATTAGVVLVNEIALVERRYALSSTRIYVMGKLTVRSMDSKGSILLQMCLFGCAGLRKCTCWTGTGKGKIARGKETPSHVPFGLVMMTG